MSNSTEEKDQISDKQKLIDFVKKEVPEMFETVLSFSEAKERLIDKLPYLLNQFGILTIENTLWMQGGSLTTGLISKKLGWEEGDTVIIFRKEKGGKDKLDEFRGPPKLVRKIDELNQHIIDLRKVIEEKEKKIQELESGTTIK